MSLWNMFLCLLGGNWVMPKTTMELLSSWEGIGNRGRKEHRWRTIPTSIWWTLWKERRCFDGHNRNLQKIRMNCISLLYFWCEQKLVGEIENLVDFIGNL
uniref:Putative ovule protein n=1 Tax=Solanum chacoense TaxID=4108 RepID=A0A0V0H8V7_SOLCH